MIRMTAATAVCLLLGGCILPPVAEGPAGCGVQVPAAYRIQDVGTEGAAFTVQETAPSGTLEVRIVDEAATPLASRSVIATRQEPTGYRSQCVAMISGETRADGKVVFERLKTGNYVVWLEPASASIAASASAVVEAGKTTAVTLTERRQ